ncbi:MAG: hypothetical protein AAF907_09325, partial [Planctomycetota bacterium]
MKKRTAAAGAGVVGLIAALFFLPNFSFGPPGLPTGDGENVTLDPTNPEDADAESVESAPVFPGAEDEPNAETGAAGMADSGDDGTGGGIAEPDAGAKPQMVEVLVDGGEYMVTTGYSVDGETQRKGMSLSAVLDLASRVKGQDGVKVRVLRTPDAIAGAVSD